MNRLSGWFLVLISLIFLNGCQSRTDEAIVQTEPTIAADVEPTAIVADDLPPRITNQFGMTFCLVPVDPSRSDHDSSYPSKSFYLQQTEIQYEDHHRFRDAALASGFDGGIDWGFNSGLPSSSGK